MGAVRKLEQNETMTIVEEGHKICKGCGRLLPLSGFYRDKGVKGGYMAKCKKCEAIRRASRTTQQGVKATLRLTDFEDTHLFAELRRRGYSGELIHSKTITI
jgi:RNase P subunit RPR2